jgi:hypothetical protein
MVIRADVDDVICGLTTEAGALRLGACEWSRVFKLEALFAGSMDALARWVESQPRVAL